MPIIEICYYNIVETFDFMKKPQRIHESIKNANPLPLPRQRLESWKTSVLLRKIKGFRKSWCGSPEGPRQPRERKKVNLPL